MAITAAAKAHLAKLAEQGAKAKPEVKMEEAKPAKKPAKKPAAKKETK